MERVGDREKWRSIVGQAKATAGCSANGIIIIIIIVIIIIINPETEMWCKRKRKEVKILEFMYRDTTNVEPEMYDYTSNN
jgi:hypothetical protein